MSNILEKGSLFDPKVVKEIINLVKGKSSLAALSASEPVSFVGNKEFTFTLDNEVNIVAESGAKSNGGATVAPKTIVPIKVEYGTRISDEFMNATEEEQINLLAPLFEGMAKKIARGIDIMAFHGVNPRDGQDSQLIGNNCFDKAITNVVDNTNDPDTDVESAIGLVEAAENDVTGMAMAYAFKSALAKQKDGEGRRLYPDLAWGKTVGAINGLPVHTNSTVSFGQSADLAIVGDFENMFKWGYAKEMTFEVIEYGNPDNDERAGDLKGHNQVYVRAEAYIGWAIIQESSFAMIKTPASH